MARDATNRGLTRLIAITLVLLVAGGAAGWYWHYQARLDRVLEAKYEALTVVNELKASRIVQWRRERLADARTLAESPFIRDALAAWPAESDSVPPWMGHLRLVQDAYGYAAVFLVDSNGRTLVAADRELSAGTPVAIKTALSRNQAMFSELYRLNDRVYLDTVAPILSDGGEVLGAVVMRMDAGEFLFPLIQAWPVPDEAAENVLFKRDGDHVRFLSDARFRAGAALTLELPVTQTQLPTVQAALGERGRLQGRDYRGIPVIAELRPIAGSDWMLMAKVDLEPLMSGVAYDTGTVVALVLLLIITAIFTLTGLYRRRQAILYQQLYRSEQQLRESTNLLRIAGRVAHLGGWKLDRTRDSLTWSPEMFDIYELPADTPQPDLTQSVDYVCPEYWERLDRAFRACIRDGVPYDLEVEMITARGRRIWIRTIGEAVCDDAGQVVEVQGAVQEITQRKQAEQELDQARQLFANTIDSLNEAVFLIDTRDRTVIRCSEAVRDIFGYVPEELIGHSTERLHLDQSSFEELGRLSEVAMAQGETFHGELQMRKKDGAIIDTENTVKALNDESGWGTGVVRVVRDISERKKAEADQEQLQVQLLQSQKMEAIGRLAGGLAHDFNNMLNVILGYTELALEQFDSDHPVHDDLREVHSAAERSAELTRQLLAFARQQTVAPEVLDLNSTVGAMLKMLNRLIGEHIALTWKPGEALGKVSMDPAQVDQILANLIVNARDAISDVGNVTIETVNAEIDSGYCQQHPDAAPGRYIMLAVSDTGHGMDEAILERIFEPFFSTKEQGLGTGLGLATVYGIVKQNNGFVNAYSEPGCGTTIKIYLPRQPDGEDKMNSGDESGGKSMPSGTETVLLVEDEEALLALGKRVLERLGYTILPTTSPGEAIRLAETYPGHIDLLLTDVVMPEMNGRDLWVRVNSLRANMKVLFMSGYTADAIAHHGVLEEGVMFIQKPYTAVTLATKLRQVLDS